MRIISVMEDDSEAEFWLASRLTGLVKEDLDLIDLSDYFKLQDYIKEGLAKKKI